MKRRSFLRMTAASIGAALIGTRVVDPRGASAVAVLEKEQEEVIPRWPTADEMGDPVGYVEQGKLILGVSMSEELVDDAMWGAIQYRCDPLSQVEVYNSKTGELLTKHRGVILLESARYGKSKWTLTVSKVARVTAIEPIHGAYKEGLEVVVVFGLDYDTAVSMHGRVESVSLFGSFGSDVMSYKVSGIVVEEVTE